MEKKNNSIKILLGFLLIIVALATALPFVLMFLVSLTQKTDLSIRFNPAEFSLKNYITIFSGSKIGRYLLNSTIVVICTCVLNVLICAFAAYPFAKKRFRGKEQLFFVYLATMMIPGQATMIPVFLIIKSMGLMNTYIALSIPFLNAFGVFLIRQFLQGLPDELLEAARIDGCTDLQLFFRIVIPLIKPVLISLTIFTFISCWNDYLWALILTTEEGMQTMTVALATLKANYTVNYGLVMAGATVTFLPPFIMYLLFQKQFVEGIALSGVKG